MKKNYLLSLTLLLLGLVGCGKRDVPAEISLHFDSDIAGELGNYFTVVGAKLVLGEQYKSLGGPAARYSLVVDVQRTATPFAFDPNEISWNDTREQGSLDKQFNVLANLFDKNKVPMFEYEFPKSPTESSVKNLLTKRIESDGVQQLIFTDIVFQLSDENGFEKLARVDYVSLESIVDLLGRSNEQAYMPSDYDMLSSEQDDPRPDESAHPTVVSTGVSTGRSTSTASTKRGSIDEEIEAMQKTFQAAGEMMKSAVEVSKQMEFIEPSVGNINKLSKAKKGLESINKAQTPEEAQKAYMEMMKEMAK